MRERTIVVCFTNFWGVNGALSFFYVSMDLQELVRYFSFPFFFKTEKMQLVTWATWLVPACGISTRICLL